MTIHKRKVKLLTMDGVTLTVGDVEYDLNVTTINDVIKTLEKECTKQYPDFQEIWLDTNEHT